VAFLRTVGMTWEDGGAPEGPRWGDERITTLVRAGVKAGNMTEVVGREIVKGAREADFRWISELYQQAGTAVWPWVWNERWESWIQPWMAAGGFRAGFELGAWRNELTPREQTCWGEGIQVESLVTYYTPGAVCRPTGVGIVRAFGRSGSTPAAWVEWLQGDWCCELSCNKCKGLGGWGGLYLANKRRWGRGEGEITSNPAKLERIETLQRLWGGEARLGKGGRQQLVWWDTREEEGEGYLGGGGGCLPTSRGRGRRPSGCWWCTIRG
jgi:hypothetical protein